MLPKIEEDVDARVRGNPEDHEARAYALAYFSSSSAINWLTFSPVTMNKSITTRSTKT